MHLMEYTSKWKCFHSKRPTHPGYFALVYFLMMSLLSPCLPLFYFQHTFSHKWGLHSHYYWMNHNTLHTGRKQKKGRMSWHFEPSSSSVECTHQWTASTYVGLCNPENSSVLCDFKMYVWEHQGAELNLMGKGKGYVLWENSISVTCRKSLVTIFFSWNASCIVVYFDRKDKKFHWLGWKALVIKKFFFFLNVLIKTFQWFYCKMQNSLYYLNVAPMNASRCQFNLCVKSS